MIRTSFLFVTMFLCTVLMANIAEFYNFSSGTETYTEITGTAVTWVGSTTGDDSMTGPVDIGFTLTYGDTTYTQVKICSNGYITLGTTPAQTNQNHLDSLAVCPVIAGLWDDLHAGRTQGTTNPVTSSVQYLASGTAGHRLFTVQFKNVYWDFATEPHNSWTNFQIIIKENNSIQIKFGPNSGTDPRPQAGASIGMSMLPGGTGNFFSITPGTPATASTTTENDTIRVHIPSGTSYYFNTAIQNDIAALELTGPNNPSMGIVNNYVVRVKNLGVLPQTNYTVKLLSATADLVSLPGEELAPGDSLDVTLAWTPTSAGVVVLTGAVILDGDENPQNDQTESMTVVVQNVIGTVAGTVKNQQNQAIAGATVTAGTYTATTATNGMYVLHIPMDSYDITASAPNYSPQTQYGVFVIAGQTLPLNFILGPVANDDNLLVTATALHSNYPNPFRTETALDYDIKTATVVRIDIFNLKGQLIRTLVNENKATGHHSTSWNGMDAAGNQVAAGVYHYRLQTGDISVTKRMLLMR